METNANALVNALMDATPSIVLVGTIGIGKTTICTKLNRMIQEKYGITVESLFEPVDKWKESGLLEKFYKDPSRWAYTFQQKAFSSRLELFTKVDWAKTELTISDGTILMDRHAFAQMLYESGHISDFEMEMYLESFQEWRNIVPAADPSIFIYLKTANVQIPLERIKSRDRREEIGISQEYMEKLQEKIELMLLLPQIASRVIVVDATKKENDVVEEIYNALLHNGFIKNIPRKTKNIKN